MPAPYFIQVSRSYAIAYISGEVDTLITEIQTIKQQIADADAQKLNLTSQLKIKQDELLTLYVQQTGQLPP